MVKKELPKRVFRKGKKPLGKIAKKVREKRQEAPIIEVKKSYRFEFPNINRFIPEWHLSSVHLKVAHFFWGGVLLVGVLFSLWQLQVFIGTYPRFSHLLSQRSKLEMELRTWQNISSQYPSYRDAHVQAALLAYQLGKQDLIETEIKAIEGIDPDFSLVKVLQAK